MKKIAIVLFVASAALAGCGKKKSAANPTPPAGDGSAEAAPAEGGGEATPAEGGGEAPAEGGGEM